MEGQFSKPAFRPHSLTADKRDESCCQPQPYEHLQRRNLFQSFPAYRLPFHRRRSERRSRRKHKAVPNPNQKLKRPGRRRPNKLPAAFSSSNRTSLISRFPHRRRRRTGFFHQSEDRGCLRSPEADNFRLLCRCSGQFRLFDSSCERRQRCGRKQNHTACFRRAR